MAGLGKYKKGAKFTLKSGNKIDPEAFFKGEVKINPSQESGIYYKSPLEAEEEKKEEKYDPYNVSGDKDEDKGKDGDEKEVVKPDKPGTKAWKVAANALIGGFDAISGTRTKRPKINFGQHEKEVAADSPEQKASTIISDILGEDYKLGDLSKREKEKTTKPKYSLTEDYKKPKTNIKGSLS